MRRDRWYTIALPATDLAAGKVIRICCNDVFMGADEWCFNGQRCVCVCLLCVDELRAMSVLTFRQAVA